MIRNSPEWDDKAEHFLKNLRAIAMKLRFCFNRLSISLIRFLIYRASSLIVYVSGHSFGSEGHGQYQKGKAPHKKLFMDQKTTGTSGGRWHCCG